MPGASQRFGIEHMDLDLEYRLRRIEQALEQKQDAALASKPWGAINLPVPRVTGLLLSEAVNGWTVEWTPLDISDLRKYEVRVSTELSFQTFTEYATRTNRLTFTDDTSTEAKYIKVRAASLSKRRSLWSSVLDTSTGGLVNTSDIEVGAITQFVEWTQDSDFVHLYDGTAGDNSLGDPTPAATEDTYGPITLSTSTDGIVVPFIFFQMEYMSIWYHDWTWFGPPINLDQWGSNPIYAPENKAVIKIKRRPVGGTYIDLNTITLDYYTTFPSSHNWWANVAYFTELYRGHSTMTGQLGVPMEPDMPGAGTWEYAIHVEVISDTGAFLYLFPSYVKVRFFEYKA